MLDRARSPSPELLSRVDLFLPAPVLGELLYGAVCSRHPQESIAGVVRPQERCTSLAVDWETAVFYSDVRHRLRLKGRPIPENDLWIAAVCLQHGLPLLTRDAHYGLVEGLTVSSAF